MTRTKKRIRLKRERISGGRRLRWNRRRRRFRKERKSKLMKNDISRDENASRL